MTIDELRDLLERRTGRTTTHPDGMGFQAHCPGPTHKGRDRDPSLSVDPGDKCIMMKCFTGCEVEDICASLGIKKGALSYERRGGRVSLPLRRRATLQPSPAKSQHNGT
jgi:hypothetical protein